MNLVSVYPELLGWAAAGLTLLAFSCNGIVRLRYTALAANAAFIAYGFAAELWPVLVLHFVLVPVNLWRLSQALKNVDPVEELPPDEIESIPTPAPDPNPNV